MIQSTRILYYEIERLESSQKRDNTAVALMPSFEVHIVSVFYEDHKNLSKSPR